MKCFKAFFKLLNVFHFYPPLVPSKKKPTFHRTYLFFSFILFYSLQFPRFFSSALMAPCPHMPP